MDHEIAPCIKKAAGGKATRLVGGARDHHARKRRRPVAIEIEKHDGAVAEPVGGQNLYVSARFAHRTASALMAMAPPPHSGGRGRGRRLASPLWRRTDPPLAPYRRTKQ